MRFREVWLWQYRQATPLDYSSSQREDSIYVQNHYKLFCGIKKNKNKKSFILYLPTSHAPIERAKQAVSLGTEKPCVKGMNVVFT